MDRVKNKAYKTYRSNMICWNYISKCPKHRIAQDGTKHECALLNKQTEVK